MTASCQASASSLGSHCIARVVCNDNLFWSRPGEACEDEPSLYVILGTFSPFIPFLYLPFIIILVPLPRFLILFGFHCWLPLIHYSRLFYLPSLITFLLYSHSSLSPQVSLQHSCNPTLCEPPSASLSSPPRSPLWPYANLLGHENLEQSTQSPPPLHHRHLGLQKFLLLAEGLRSSQSGMAPLIGRKRM